MNIAKISVISSMIFLAQLSSVYAQDVASLPAIQLMADDELRNEVVTTVTPFQEDEKVRKALQHQIIKKEQGVQNTMLNDQMGVNIQPQASLPDMSQLTPLQRDYVLSIAAGFKSADPSSGIFKMLEPLGIDREKALNQIRQGGGAIPINLDEQRLNQLFGDQWRGGVK